ncbi:Nucleoside diphosphate kinase [Rhynchospora pubera]|uniref:Nucleoside diphosphate kinase n=1 Tax=Rhynchospora pubera TaxID=906938 RepID=A0AAV8CDL3_9POAL|nr:Nucleoside diphosphate kinase [Rhynchospora pubera]
MKILLSLSSFLLLLTHLFLFSVCQNHEAQERTLAMIKPDGLQGDYTDQIKAAILEAGFEIVEESTFQLDFEKASLFYAEHSGKTFFQSLIAYITSGPVLAMVLEKPNAILEWRALIGPTNASKAKVSHPRSIRAMCGMDSERNCVHGSDSPQSARREILFFFGDKMNLSDFEKHDEL